MREMGLVAGVPVDPAEEKAAAMRRRAKRVVKEVSEHCKLYNCSCCCWWW